MNKTSQSPPNQLITQHCIVQLNSKRFEILVLRVGLRFALLYLCLLVTFLYVLRFTMILPINKLILRKYIKKKLSPERMYSYVFFFFTRNYSLL